MAPKDRCHRFVWNVRSPQVVAEPLEPVAWAACHRKLQQGGIEDEASNDERQQKQWAHAHAGTLSSALGRGFKSSPAIGG